MNLRAILESLGLLPEKIGIGGPLPKTPSLFNTKISTGDLFLHLFIRSSITSGAILPGFSILMTLISACVLASEARSIYLNPNGYTLLCAKMRCKSDHRTEIRWPTKRDTEYRTKRIGPNRITVI